MATTSAGRKAPPHKTGPHVIEFAADPNQRRKRRNDRKKCLMTKANELAIITGGSVLVHFYDRLSNKTFAFASDEEIWQLYATTGIHKDCHNLESIRCNGQGLSCQTIPIFPSSATSSAMPPPSTTSNELLTSAMPPSSQHPTSAMPPTSQPLTSVMPPSSQFLISAMQPSSAMPPPSQPPTSAMPPPSQPPTSAMPPPSQPPTSVMPPPSQPPSSAMPPSSQPPTSAMPLPSSQPPTSAMPLPSSQPLTSAMPLPSSQPPISAMPLPSTQPPTSAMPLPSSAIPSVPSSTSLSKSVESGILPSQPLISSMPSCPSSVTLQPSIPPASTTALHALSSSTTVHPPSTPSHTSPFQLPTPKSQSSPKTFSNITINRSLSFPSPTKKSSLNISCIAPLSPSHLLPDEPSDMPMDITEFLERDTLEISILDLNNIPSNIIDSSQTINTVPAPINTTPSPMIKTPQRIPRKRQISQNLKDFMQSLNKKNKHQTTISSSAPQVDPNHCFVCRGKYTTRGRRNNPWIGCDRESVCQSWAHMKCIGWGHLVGEDVDELPYLCPKCASQ